jgi:glyoxylase-like metal-dependent hydrolase (beta-lactamase superfamily II)/ferredoxin
MSAKMKLSANVPGSFYVNSACINCDTCRQLAVGVFSEISGYSAVTKQPQSPEEEREAYHALLSCPTAAIVSRDKQEMASAMEDFPLQLEDEVYYCGFTSSRSFGGSSYLVTHSDGNWLIDAPRYVPHLVKKFELMGGIDTIFLTHRDDVADARQYAEKFGAKRIIHEDERAAQPDAEHFIKGIEPVEWAPDYRIIPVPGHTKGHMVLLYKHRYLFTGDHLEWDRDRLELSAYEDYCWYSWKEQTRSMRRLIDESFEWVLPGHGNRIQLEQSRMKDELVQLVERMEKTIGSG